MISNPDPLLMRPLRLTPAAFNERALLLRLKRTFDVAVGVSTIVGRFVCASFGVGRVLCNSAWIGLTGVYSIGGKVAFEIGV